MASNTENLNLLMKNPSTDGADTFNVDTMLNENWRKIDANAGSVAKTLANILKPTTPPIIGLPPSTTPDGMFQALGNTGELHVWRKTTVTPAGTTTTYPVSTNPNAYQEGDNAKPAGTTIEYLGKLGDKARVQVVSYVGTGTYGSSNPNSVTANFPIKLLAVLAKTLKNSNGNFSTRIDYNNQYYEDPFMVGAILTTNYTIGSGCGYKQNLSVYDTSYGKKSNDGKTFSWYTTGSNPARQFNESGYTYIVLLIG